MMDNTGTANASVVSAASAAFNVHQLSEATRIFQQNSYQAAAAAASAGVVSPFGNHLSAHPGAVNHHPHPGQLSTSGSQSQSPHSAGITSMGPPHGVGGMAQLSHGLTGSSQQIAAALFANSPLISDDLKLAAAAAAAAAAVQSARGKKTHRAEPVPQSGFKGVSWNSRMKAWLAFYVTENGERKSKTFSTRKLGMEEARLQAITFCKQKQDQRREARKRNRELQNQHCSTGLDKLSSDESMMDSPASGLDHLLPASSQSQNPSAGASSSSNQSSLRCGYPTTPGMGMMSQSPTQPQSSVAGTQNGSEIAYVPIVPIAMDMIEKSGLLQPLELNVLPPCQHCNKQPYPFLMIVSEGQEQSYSGSSIMSLAASHGQGTVTVPQGPGDQQSQTNPASGMSGMDSSTSNTPLSDQTSTPVSGNGPNRLADENAKDNEDHSDNQPNDLPRYSVLGGCGVKSQVEGSENQLVDDSSSGYTLTTHHSLNPNRSLNPSGHPLGGPSMSPGTMNSNGKLGVRGGDDDQNMSPSTSSSDPTSFSPNQSAVGALLAMGDAPSQHLSQSQHAAVLLNHQLGLSGNDVNQSGATGLLRLGDISTGQQQGDDHHGMDDDQSDVMQTLRAFGDHERQLLRLGSVDINDRADHSNSGMLTSL